MLCCPECHSSKLKFNTHKIICLSCRSKYRFINDVPILVDTTSKKILQKELFSTSGYVMVKEYIEPKKHIPVPDLTFNIFDRKKLHKLFTHNENEDYVVLNVGGGPKREEKNVLNLNIGPFPNVDVVADAHNLPFRSDSLDSIMMAAVLEHVQNPQKVVEEAFRVLKKGGFIYAETPFLQHFHGYPDHYQNFTLIGHNFLFRKFTKIETGPTTGPFSTILILISNFFDDFIEHKYMRKILLILTCSFLYPFKYLDIFFKKNLITS